MDFALTGCPNCGRITVLGMPRMPKSGRKVGNAIGLAAIHMTVISGAT